MQYKLTTQKVWSTLHSTQIGSGVLRHDTRAEQNSLTWQCLWGLGWSQGGARIHLRWQIQFSDHGFLESLYQQL